MISMVTIISIVIHISREEVGSKTGQTGQNGCFQIERALFNDLCIKVREVTGVI